MLGLDLGVGKQCAEFNLCVVAGTLYFSGHGDGGIISRAEPAKSNLREYVRVNQCDHLRLVRGTRKRSVSTHCSPLIRGASLLNSDYANAVVARTSRLEHQGWERAKREGRPMNGSCRDAPRRIRLKLT